MVSFSVYMPLITLSYAHIFSGILISININRAYVSEAAPKIVVYRYQLGD